MAARDGRDAVIAGVGLTQQARELPGESTFSLMLAAGQAAVDDCGLSFDDIDGMSADWPGPGGSTFNPGPPDWAEALGISLRWIGSRYAQGIPAVMDACAAIDAGYCKAVLIVSGQGGLRQLRESQFYTTPENEFVAPFGSFTAAQFALVAQRYLHECGNRADAVRAGVSDIAARVRNMGAGNRRAVQYGSDLLSAENVEASPMIASPLHRLDVCLVNEGAVALVVARSDLLDPSVRRVFVNGGGCEWHKQQYVSPSRFEDAWYVGRRAAVSAFEMAQMTASNVGYWSLYDATAFEIIRHFEMMDLCAFGHGEEYVRSLGLEPETELPINTDGGLLSASHSGSGGPSLRVADAVQQVRGTAGAGQVRDLQAACVTGAGSAPMYHNILIMSPERTAHA